MNDNISTIKINPINSFLINDAENSDIEVNEWLLSDQLKTDRINRHIHSSPANF